MPVVTDITAQKRSADIYNIFIDDEFVCGLSALELSSAGVKVGLELSGDDVTRLVTQSRGSKAFNAALRYLSYRPRSEHEVRDYLMRKDYDDEIITPTLDRLKQNAFVDDRAFAQSWLRSRQASAPRSRRVLRLELMKKRVSRDVIESVLVEQDAVAETEALRRVAEKKLRLPRFSQDRQKLTQYLVAQGYTYGDVKRILDELTRENYETNNGTDYNEP